MRKRLGYLIGAGRANEAARAWPALYRADRLGPHFAFYHPVIVALERHHILTAPAEGYPACGQRQGALVVARRLSSGQHALYCGGRLWLRGDAFDVGREFYALVGFNSAPAAAQEALVGEIGEARTQVIMHFAVTACDGGG